MKTQVLAGISLLLVLLAACAPQAEPLETAEPLATTEPLETAEPLETTEPPETAEPLEAAEPPETTVVRNGMLFTAAGGELIPAGAVVIEGGRITAAGPDAELEYPEDATLIDAQGGTIMPGLVEARASTLLNRLTVADGEIDPIALQVYLVNPLQAGVTTIRAVGWDYQAQPDLTELREALATQGNHVPTVVFAGMVTHAEGNVFAIYPQDSTGVVTVAEAQQAAEDLIEAGADQIGFLQAIPPDNRAGDAAESRTSLSADQQAAVVEAAHDSGVWVIAQTSYREDTAAAVAAGVDEIVAWPHGTEEPLPDELIQALVENSVPVMTGFSVGVIRPYEGDVRRFIDAGGTVVFGTFAPNAVSLDRPHTEMSLMELLGDMTPQEVLTAATANSAQAVGLGDEIGTLEAGKKADILVVQGNPLDDLRDVRDVVMVIKAGEVVFRAEETD